MLRDAIAFYNDLLDDQSAVEAQAALNEQMRARRLFFGERPICNVLRPHFYKPEQWDFLKRETETLLRAFANPHFWFAWAAFQPQTRIYGQ
ncbi:MAG: hypothetical protein ACK4P1_00265 [Aggregatilineales bacterium]